MVEVQSVADVEIRRSQRRRKTVSAHREGKKIVVLVPATLSADEEAEWVEEMVKRVTRAEAKAQLSDADLLDRATALSREYLAGMAEPLSVRWVDNQRTRWGSCTPGDRSVRLSSRLNGMPSWVVDYVLIHELAHLLEPGHDEAFWSWVDRYPEAEKAKGFLLGWSAALSSPQSEDSEDPAEPLMGL